MSDRNRGIILSYINIFLNMLSGMFLSVFLLKKLGATDYGVYQTISSFANYLVLFEFGTAAIMTRNISLCLGRGDEEAIKKNISTVWGITLFLTAIIFIVSYVFYCSIDNIYKESLTAEQIQYAKHIFIFVTVFLVLSYLAQTLNGVIMAFEKYTLRSAINIAKNCIRLVTLIALISNFPESVYIAVTDMVISIFIFVIEYIYCKRKFKISFSLRYFDSEILRGALPLCVATFIQLLVNQANNNVDKFIIGIKLNPETVSLYSIALFVFSVFSSLTTIPVSMYGPQITQAVGRKSTREELAKMMVSPGRIIVLVGGSIVFGFFAAGRQFIEIAYGKEYISAWLIAVILMFPKLFNMANEVTVNVLNAENRWAFRSGVLVFVTIFNIALTVYWIDVWGIIGAAVATGVTTFLGHVIIMNIYYSRCIKIPMLKMLFEVFKGIFPWQIIAAVSGFFAGKAVENVYISIIASIFVYICIFGIGYFLAGATEDEKKMIRKFLRK